MGCGIKAWKDELEEKAAEEARQRFRDIAKDDGSIKVFLDKLEDVNRNLHNFTCHDVPLTRRQARELDTALSKVQELMKWVRS